MIASREVTLPRRVRPGIPGGRGKRHQFVSLTAPRCSANSLVALF